MSRHQEPSRRSQPREVDDRVGVTVKWHERPEVVRLQKQWYDRLRAEGFVDIEYRNAATGSGDWGFLENHWIGTARRVVRAMESGTDEFYRLVGWWMHEAPRWQTRRHRLAWAAYSAGAIAVEIAGSALAPRVHGHGERTLGRDGLQAWLRKQVKQLRAAYRVLPETP